jgi:hypothetical protein
VGGDRPLPEPEPSIRESACLLALPCLHSRPLCYPQLLAISGTQLCRILLPWAPTDWLPDLLLCPLTGHLLCYLSGQLPQACPASVSAHSPRSGRQVKPCSSLCDWLPPIPQGLVCVSALARSSLSNWGLCWEWVLKKTPAWTPTVRCICKSCPLPSSGKSPPPPPHSPRPSCYPAPAPPETLEQLLAQRVRLEAGLGWPGWSSSEAGLQWDLLRFPPWIAVPPDTPQASSSPPTPPTSFPPPEAEVTGSPGLGWGCHHLAVGEEAGPWGLLS